MAIGGRLKIFTQNKEKQMLKNWLLIFAVLFTTAVHAEIKVLAFAGSLRKDSFNKKLVLEAADIAKKMHAKVTYIDLKDFPLPFYDADLESKEGMPANAKRLRQLMKQSDVIFIASPEYNGSLSAVLKNALDWSSRSEEGGGAQDAFKGKKFALMSASPGPGGGKRALVHLKAVIENVGGIVLPLEVSVPNAYEAFNDQGNLKDPQLKMNLEKLVQAALK